MVLPYNRENSIWETIVNASTPVLGKRRAREYAVLPVARKWRQQGHTFQEVTDASAVCVMTAWHRTRVGTGASPRHADLRPEHAPPKGDL